MKDSTHYPAYVLSIFFPASSTGFFIRHHSAIFDNFLGDQLQSQDNECGNYYQIIKMSDDGDKIRDYIEG